MGFGNNNFSNSYPTILLFEISRSRQFSLFGFFPWNL